MILPKQNVGSSPGHVKTPSVEKVSRVRTVVLLIVLAGISLPALVAWGQAAGPLPVLPPMHLSPTDRPVDPSLFGLHIHRPAPDTWPQVSSFGWRLWDTKGATWSQLEPRRGEWNFALLDQDVAMAEQHRTPVLLVLGQTPVWASSNPQAPPAWNPGATAPPTDEGDWQTYVRTVATRYKGRIHQYEVWNEPNLKDFYSGSRDQLLVLAKDAFEIIHSIDPEAIVVSPSVTGSYDIGWFKHYLDLGGGRYADVIGYHFYSSPHSPEASVDTIQKVLSVMRASHVEKPLWNTEAGYLIKSSFNDVPPKTGTLSRVLSQDEAVAYVMRAYLLNWATGASRLYWYDWDGTKMGLGDNGGKQKKPAAYAYAAIERWMIGATFKRCDSDAEQNWTCVLERSGHVEYIVWNADTTVSKNVPADWKIRQLETLSADGQTHLQNISAVSKLSYQSLPSLIR